MGEIRIRQVETPQQIADVQALMREYLDWWMAREKDAPQAPTFENAYDEIDGLPGIYVSSCCPLYMNFCFGRFSDASSVKLQALMMLLMRGQNHERSESNVAWNTKYVLERTHENESILVFTSFLFTNCLRYSYSDPNDSK